MIVAARVSKTFGLDPVMVLDSKPFHWIIRVAASNIANQEESNAGK